MTKRSRVAAAVFALTCAPVVGAIGQTVSFGAAATVSSTRLSITGSTPQSNAWRGVVGGLEGFLGVGPVRVNLAYGEGRLGVGGAQIDYVEGAATLGVTVANTFTLLAGPHVRSRGLEASRVRTTALRIGGRYEADILRTTQAASSTRAFIEGWAALTRSADDAVGAPRQRGGGGGSAGLLVRVRRLELRVGYAIDEAGFGDPAQRQAVETVILAVGIRR